MQLPKVIYNTRSCEQKGKLENVHLQPKSDLSCFKTKSVTMAVSASANDSYYEKSGNEHIQQHLESEFQKSPELPQESTGNR